MNSFRSSARDYLANNVSLLRKLLGEASDSTRFIETVPKRGYRFTGAVREVCDEGADLILEKHTVSSVLIQDRQQSIAEESPALAGAASTKRLRWTIAAASAIAILGVAAYFLIATRSNRPAGIRSMAVLPFRSLSADTTDEYIGIGMSDALITRLGGVPEVIIRPTSAVRKYGGADQDPLAAGRELTWSRCSTAQSKKWAIAFG